MNRDELLTEMLDNPEYLSDSYYKDVGKAMRERYAKLEEKEKSANNL